MILCLDKPTGINLTQAARILPLYADVTAEVDYSYLHREFLTEKRRVERAFGWVDNQTEEEEGEWHT